MFGKFMTDLRRPKQAFQLSKELHNQTLGEYYFLFEEDRIAAGADQKLISKFDDNGIPINKTYIDVQDKEYVYFPISIGQMGLSVFHTYLNTKSNEDKARFLKFSDWFMEHGEKDKKLGLRWMTDVSLPAYKNPGPWQSAFSQARGISILLRAYQLTEKQAYADFAKEALKPFLLPVDKGGVTSFTDHGPFYEEYTAEVPTLVLNGMIFALCGVYDFIRVFPENKDAKKIFDEGIKTLEAILPEFDMGYWSRYNLCKAEWYPEIDPATIGYQRLHATQLELLYKITGKKIFDTYVKRFRKQDTFVNALHMYKVKYRALKQIGRL
ncbi:MAG: D-glucuronyl C5-epimerase family protein [Candidatus Marinimicrobia bacterium]|nr:D-glucuronyl C5-epimerase family protein [Candidatus Neomarinimicrobiota bacterium]